SVRSHDGDPRPAKDPYEIDADAMARVVEALNALRMRDPDRLGDWFGRFITHYRSVDVSSGEPPRPRIEIEFDLTHRGATLERHPFSRMAWRRARREGRLFVSGHEFTLPIRDAKRLAAAERIDAALYASLSEVARDV